MTGCGVEPSPRPEDLGRRVTAPAPAYPVTRNAVLLAGGLVCLNGAVQLFVALATVTLVAVTGIEGILGLGPAIYLTAGALAVFPAGRLGDRVGRMPVIRVGFVAGILAALATGIGCGLESATLVIVGFALFGASGSVVLLSRAAAAEMFRPERRARGISLVLFGAVSAAIFGPLVFGPMFAGRSLTPEDLVVPWLSAGLFMLAGLAVSCAVRPDPKTIGEALHTTALDASTPAAPLLEIVRRPGVPTALIGSVTSFAVMVGVMNLSGYVAVGRHHHQGDVFTIISLHIVGMYGLVLFVGDIVERIGRRTSIVLGLAVMAVSNALLWPLEGIAGMSLSLFGLGLGWSLSYVAATAELVELAAPAERGRLIGFNDLLSALTGAALALAGGVLYSETGATALALAAALLAAGPALVVLARGRGATAALEGA
jgi:MFS family permease